MRLPLPSLLWHDGANTSRLAILKRMGILKQDYDNIRTHSVAVLGLGGIGSIIAEQMVRSGVGVVVGIDRDIVRQRSLGRMTYRPEHLGMTKAQAARIRLTRLNADTDVRAVCADIMDDEHLPMIINALKLRATTDLFREDKSSTDDVDHEDDEGSDEERKKGSDAFGKRKKGEEAKHVDMVICAISDELCRLKINSICLGLDVPLVAVKCDDGAVGGEVQFSMPGHTACLQCWGLPPSLLRSQSTINIEKGKEDGVDDVSSLNSVKTIVDCFSNSHDICNSKRVMKMPRERYQK